MDRNTRRGGRGKRAGGGGSNRPAAAAAASAAVVSGGPDPVVELATAATTTSASPVTPRVAFLQQLSKALASIDYARSILRKQPTNLKAGGEFQRRSPVGFAGISPLQKRTIVLEPMDENPSQEAIDKANKTAALLNSVQESCVKTRDWSQKTLMKAWAIYATCDLRSVQFIANKHETILVALNKAQARFRDAQAQFTLSRTLDGYKAAHLAKYFRQAPDALRKFGSINLSLSDYDSEYVAARWEDVLDFGFPIDNLHKYLSGLLATTWLTGPSTVSDSAGAQGAVEECDHTEYMIEFVAESALEVPAELITGNFLPEPTRQLLQAIATFSSRLEDLANLMEGHQALHRTKPSGCFNAGSCVFFDHCKFDFHDLVHNLKQTAAIYKTGFPAAESDDPRGRAALRKASLSARPRGKRNVADWNTEC